MIKLWASKGGTVKLKHCKNIQCSNSLFVEDICAGGAVKYMISSKLHALCVKDRRRTEQKKYWKADERVQKIGKKAMG